MRRSTLPLLLAPAAMIVAGCAHTKDQYAYAYPSAPPVYTQPAGYAAPAVNPAAGQAVMPAAVATLPPGAVVAGTLPAGALPSGSLPAGATMMPGSVTSLPPGAVLISDTVAHAGAISEGPCPPMSTHGMTADGTLLPYAGESQTIPCPQEFVSEVGPGSFVR
ncbi:MAG: hypothetical protein WCJ31_13075 [Planctomycetia bacterium]